MKEIKLLNPVSPVWNEVISDQEYALKNDAENPVSIIVRSADMHSYELEKDVLAVARAGVGVNNIPLDKYAEEGVVVFNTPGANANAVKELNVYGDEDYDVLTLSGEIDNAAENTVTETPIVSGAEIVAYDFVIKAASSAAKLITINAYNLNALADGITNKAETKITGDQINGDVILVSNSFTNYIVDSDVLSALQDGTLTMRAGEGQKL